MQVAIIKYNAGNTRSVENALIRLGITPIITDVKEEIQNADKVIFPGVGHAQSAMAHLRAKGLDVVIKDLKQPTLGICLGMQLMCTHSEEGDTACLDIFKAPVVKFKQGYFKVPQMGWNNITPNPDSMLFKAVNRDAFVYNVHSYYVPLCDDTVATCDYGVKFSTALAKDNFSAVQFHPEKSATVGAKIIDNFLKF